jgi:hypothetical protein
MKKTEYRKESYMGYKINCSQTLPCYLGILSDLFERTKIAQRTFTRPLGFHVRYRLKDNVDPRLVTDRLNKFYTLKSKHRLEKHTFSPLWVKAFEYDPDQDDHHCHLAIILEGRVATGVSLNTFFDKLVKQGLLENRKVISAYDPRFKKGVDLKTEEGVAYYFEWLSYIAKVRSKEFITQTHSSNRLKRSA